jgi:hypothetical protein
MIKIQFEKEIPATIPATGMKENWEQRTTTQIFKVILQFI